MNDKSGFLYKWHHCFHASGSQFKQLYCKVLLKMLRNARISFEVNGARQYSEVS